MTNTNTILENLNRLNEQLAGAPSGVFVFIVVLCLAFALRWWDLFPDKYVAPTSTLLGTLVFCLLAPYAQEHMRIWLVKNAGLGFVISFVASVAMLKFGDKLPIIGNWLKTEEPKPTQIKP